MLSGIQGKTELTHLADVDGPRVIPAWPHSFFDVPTPQPKLVLLKELELPELKFAA
jgi:hypothetical protein